MVVRGRHLRVAARDAKTFLHLGRPTLHVFPPVCMSVERMKARRFLHLGPPFCISGSQPCMSANQFPMDVVQPGGNCKHRFSPFSWENQVGRPHTQKTPKPMTRRKSLNHSEVPSVVACIVGIPGNPATPWQVYLGSRRTDFSWR